MKSAKQFFELHPSFHYSWPFSWEMEKFAEKEKVTLISKLIRCQYHFWSVMIWRFGMISYFITECFSHATYRETFVRYFLCSAHKFAIPVVNTGISQTALYRATGLMFAKNKKKKCWLFLDTLQIVFQKAPFNWNFHSTFCQDVSNAWTFFCNKQEIKLDLR